MARHVRDRRQGITFPTLSQGGRVMSRRTGRNHLRYIVAGSLTKLARGLCQTRRNLILPGVLAAVTIVLALAPTLQSAEPPSAKPPISVELAQAEHFQHVEFPCALNLALRIRKLAPHSTLETIGREGFESQSCRVVQKAIKVVREDWEMTVDSDYSGTLLRVPFKERMRRYQNLLEHCVTVAYTGSSLEDRALKAYAARIGPIHFEGSVRFD